MIVAGIDEVGRGPLAGPVLAAAVILGKKHGLTNLKDSKKLSALKREKLNHEIKQNCVAWAIGIASVKEIDAVNILQASLLAMRRAVLALPITPDRLLVDGTHSPGLDIPTKTIIGGDDLIIEISAASIIAKVARDHLMSLFDKRYPDYLFSKHKGYGTRDHLAALKRYGVTKLHRRSFAPVRERLEA